MADLQLSRRLFLGGIAGLGVGSIVKTRTEVPVLWGDMINDDAPALNALFRGDPVRVLRGRAILGERPSLVGAECLLASTVTLPEGAHIVMMRNTLMNSPGFDGPLLRFGGGSCGLVADTHFRTQGARRPESPLMDW